MTVTMFDSTDAKAIPAGAAAVAGYVGGKWPSYNSIVSRFPKAHHVSIAVSASEDAACLDIENGDATISQAPAWVRRQHARGITRPILYLSISGVQQLIATMTAASIHRSEYLIWSAHYTGTPHIEEDCDATQYRNDEAHNVDISLCSDTFFGIAPKPPTPKPKPGWFPNDEINWEREWDTIISRKTIAAHLRRLFLKALMRKRIAQIKKLAAKTGWALLNRRERCDKLEARAK
jgi:hypothetical protein